MAVFDSGRPSVPGHPVAGRDTPDLASQARDPAGEFAAFTHALRPEDLPNEVLTHAKLLILDAVGVAAAATECDFVTPAMKAMATQDSAIDNSNPVIGCNKVAPLRDAAHLNGMLIHGMDYDDTHLQGVVHVCSAVLPAILGIADQEHASGAETLLSFVAASEVLIRLGIAAEGELNQVGLFPTSQLGVYAATLAAGRLRRLSEETLMRAQGLAGCMASGSLLHLTDTSWTKPYQAGWASANAITAVDFALHGFLAPREPYVGRFGFYQHALGKDGPRLRHALTGQLGYLWETKNISIKPYPACHMAHAFIQAAVELRENTAISPEVIRSVECLVAPGQVATICEPWTQKQQAATFRDRQFSLPYLVSLALLKGNVKAEQLDSDWPEAPLVNELASRVRYRTDDTSRFPDEYEGEVILTLQHGSEFRRRVDSIRGCPDLPMSQEHVVDKFRKNSEGCFSRAGSDALIKGILNLEKLPDTADLVRVLKRDTD